MCFEDEFMGKQSEIISLYKEAASAKSELLYVYIYNDDSQSLIASAYRVDEKVVGNVKAGVSDEIDNKIYNIITEEIMPELNEICQRYNREIPVVFKYTYNLKTGSFDSEYLYAKDVAEDYECGTEALKWIKSR